MWSISLGRIFRKYDKSKKNNSKGGLITRAMRLSLSHLLWTVKDPLKIDWEPVKNQYKCNNYMKWHSNHLKGIGLLLF